MNFRIPFFLQVFLVSSFVASDPDPNAYGNPQDGCETGETDQCLGYDADSNCQEDMCSASCKDGSDCPVGSYPFKEAACLTYTNEKAGKCVPMCTTDIDCKFLNFAHCYNECYTNQDKSYGSCCAYSITSPAPTPTPPAPTPTPSQSGLSDNYGDPLYGCGGGGDSETTLDVCVGFSYFFYDETCTINMCSADCTHKSDCPLGIASDGFLGAKCVAGDLQAHFGWTTGKCFPMCTTDSDCDYAFDGQCVPLDMISIVDTDSTEKICVYEVPAPWWNSLPGCSRNWDTWQRCMGESGGILLGGLLLMLICCCKCCCKKKPAAQQSEPLINPNSISSSYNTAPPVSSSTSSFIDVEQNSGGAPADYSMPGITWKPPSKRKEALTLRHKLEELLDQLVANDTWTSEERATITGKHLPAAKSFLDHCKAEAAKDLAPLKFVINKLEKRYKALYDVTTDMIQTDDLAWPQVLELGNKLERQSLTGTKFCQDRNQLVRLYQDAQRVKPTFDSVFRKIAASTNGKFLPGTLKPLFRALEKTVMKRSDDPTLDRAERVCDVVRGMLVYENFGGMVRGMQAMVGHANVEHMRTKSRFAVPTSGGWRDVVSNIRFPSDEQGHICEIQFVHERMLVVRKQMGGHDEYNYFRSAIELLEVVDGSD